MNTNNLPTSLEFLASTATSGTVCDVGCYGWRLGQMCAAQSRTLIGIDVVEPPDKPVGAQFALSTPKGFELASDSADVTIATHVLEHIHDPVMFFSEVMRVTRPGGLVYIEVPSELGAMVASSDDPQDHGHQSFWDEPTHVRPWTPGALYRLAIMCFCYPLTISRAVTGPIPVVRFVGRKPFNAKGKTEPRYLSFEHVAPGLSNAWASVWGDTETVLS